MYIGKLVKRQVSYDKKIWFLLGKNCFSLLIIYRKGTR